MSDKKPVNLIKPTKAVTFELNKIEEVKIEDVVNEDENSLKKAMKSAHDKLKLAKHNEKQSRTFFYDKGKPKQNLDLVKKVEAADKEYKRVKAAYEQVKKPKSEFVIETKETTLSRSASALSKAKSIQENMACSADEYKKAKQSGKPAKNGSTSGHMHNDYFHYKDKSAEEPSYKKMKKTSSMTY